MISGIFQGADGIVQSLPLSHGLFAHANQRNPPVGDIPLDFRKVRPQQGDPVPGNQLLARRDNGAANGGKPLAPSSYAMSLRRIMLLSDT